MRLYIPTTSLNFNNILSADSISPKGFYAMRGFGYSRWFTIPENDMEGAILLYESPAHINRPVSEMEDHPLLIEIDTDEEFPVLKQGIRYSQHTIYLNPWNTTFLFENDKDKTTALSLSDSSLETKMMRLYSRKIIVRTQYGEFPSLDGALSISVDNKYIEEDIRTNKIKGLLYGYYIGASLSAPKEYIAKLNVLREIQNVFAAVVSSQERVPSTSQKENLKHLFAYLQREEPIYIALKNEIGEDNTEKAISILEKFGVNIIHSNWRRIVNELQYDASDNNMAINWINSELKKQQRTVEQHTRLLSVNDEEIVTSCGKVCKIANTVVSNEEEMSLYLAWINDLLVSNKYNGKVSSTKESLADDLTQIAISCLGEKWKDSYIRTFLNQLRRHVRGEEFTQPWENGILSSVASAITKGDDWESMLRFMQTKGITDYRLAFSFYGVLNGFANLTRDFTDKILNLNSAYVSEVYREFYGQLHGVTISVQSSHDVNSVSGQQIEMSQEPSTDSALSSFVGHDNTLTAQSFVHEILTFFQSSAFKNAKNKDKLKEGLRLCLERNKEMTDISQFIFDLNDFDDYGWSKNNKPWKTMQEKFCPNYKEKVGQKKKVSAKKSDDTTSFFGKAFDVAETIIDNAKEIVSRTIEKVTEPEDTSTSVSNELATEPTSSELINDSSVILYLKTLEYLEPKEFEKLSRDILYIQKEYQPGGKYAKGGVKESDPSNKQVIKHLGNLTLMNNRTPRWEDIVQRLKNDLSIRYNVQ